MIWENSPLQDTKKSAHIHIWETGTRELMAFVMREKKKKKKT